MSVLHALPEAAQLLGGISIWTLRKHVATGRLRVTRIGRRVFLDADEVERVRREGLPSLANHVRAAPLGPPVAVDPEP